MANPIIKVVLSAVDEVTGVAKKAGDGVSSFADRAKGALAALGALGVGVALGAFFKSSLEEAAKAEVGMGRLGTAVRNAGGSFATLKPALEGTIASVQRLSTYTDDDLRESLSRMIALSGDVAGSQKNLSLVTDLAAFKQISLSDASDIVARAMNGNVTALNKMGIAGKSATEVLENARASFGGFAQNEANSFQGTLTRLNNGWDDFKEAVGTAILSTGEMGSVGNVLVGVLADLVSWVEDNEGQFRLVTNAIGTAAGALYDVGRTIYEVLGPALGFLIKLVGGTLLFAIENAAYTVKGLAAAFEYMAGHSLQALGYLVEKGGALLKIFGVQVVAEAGTSIRQFGERLVSSASDSMGKANAAWKRGMTDLIAGRAEGNAKLEREEQRTGKAQGAEHDAQVEKRLKAEADALKKAQEARDKANAEQLKQLKAIGAQLAAEQKKQNDEAGTLAELLATQLRVNLGEASAKALRLTSEAMAELLTQLRGKIPLEQWQALNEAVQQHKRDLSDLLPPASSLAEAAKDAAAANKKYGEELQASKKSTEQLVQDSGNLARAFVDAASATGVIDDKMANVLNSAISLAVAIPKAFGGDPTSIAQAVVSLANIIVGIGSSETEKRRAANSAANTSALERLTREVGNLNLRESGKTFAGVQTAVDASIQARADARASGKGPGDADKAAKAAFLTSLKQQGIGLEEARSLFKEMFGRDLSMADAGTFFQDIQAFGTGLASVEFGQFGQGFEGQLDAITKGFDILGTNDADDKLEEFKSLVGKFSPALAEALNVDLSSPEGRAKATENMQRLFQKLKSGGLSPEEIGVSGNQFLSLISTILPLLGDANGLLGSGLSVGTGITSGPVGGVPAIGGSSQSIAAPGLPTFSTSPGLPDAFGAGAPGGLQIAGGFNTSITVNVIPNPGDDTLAVADAVVDRVDQLFFSRVASLEAAAGVVTQVRA